MRGFSFTRLPCLAVNAKADAPKRPFHPNNSQSWTKSSKGYLGLTVTRDTLVHLHQPNQVYWFTTSDHSIPSSYKKTQWRPVQLRQDMRSLQEWKIVLESPEKLPTQFGSSTKVPSVPQTSVQPTGIWKLHYCFNLNEAFNIYIKVYLVCSNPSR